MKSENVNDELSVLSRIVERTLTLEIEELRLQVDIPFDAPARIRQGMAENFARKFVFLLATRIAFQRETLRINERVASVPATWLDAFKLRWFPKWLQRWFPVRMTEIRFQREYELRAYFPCLPPASLGSETTTRIYWRAQEGKP